MTSVSRSLFLVVSLVTTPAAVSFAQGTGTAAGGPAQGHPAAGAVTFPQGTHGATNANRPGATGQTVVPGDKSTLNGSEPATDAQQSGTVQGR